MGFMITFEMNRFCVCGNLVPQDARLVSNVLCLIHFVGGKSSKNKGLGTTAVDSRYIPAHSAPFQQRGGGGGVIVASKNCDIIRTPCKLNYTTWEMECDPILFTFLDRSWANKLTDWMKVI